MATIYDYLPRFHQVEPNNLKALQPGFVVSQMEVAETCTLVTTNSVAGTKHLENGHIVTISADGIVDVTAANQPLFINYTEPLNTLFDSPKMYAVDLACENPRLVQLIPGDEFTTDFDYFNDAQYASIKSFLTGRIVEVTAESKMSNDDWFKSTTLADGTPAHHYLVIA